MRWCGADWLVWIRDNLRRLVCKVMMIIVGNDTTWAYGTVKISSGLQA